MKKFILTMVAIFIMATLVKAQSKSDFANWVIESNVKNSKNPDY